jgi:hypothetical protein
VAYVHTSDSRLYGMTAQLAMVDHGAMGCAPLVDIALDASGRLFATTPFTFFEVEIETGTCTAIASNGNFPNSLAVVPAGVLDPGDDTVVGLRGNEYVRIDKQTGAVLVLSTIGPQMSSSGDLTYLDGVLYATVSGAVCSDCILGIQAQTGQVVFPAADVGYGQVFGVADASGILYGFTADGLLLQLGPNGGAMPLSANLGSIYGATSAP